jgi:hypothetical protein
VGHPLVITSTCRACFGATVGEQHRDINLPHPSHERVATHKSQHGCTDDRVRVDERDEMMLPTNGAATLASAALVIAFGISTTPDRYTQTLTQIATHGFVIVACNDTQVERPCMSAGLNWLITQDASGAMREKLDISREATIGYSWGGGAAIDSSDRVNVKATVALHGIPLRVTGAFERLHAPLLLFTSTGDTFVGAEGHVTPNSEKSLVETFYATLADASADHLRVVDAAAQRMEVTPPIRHGGVLFAEPQGDA